MPNEAEKEVDQRQSKTRESNLEALLGLMKLKRGELLTSNKKIRTHKNNFQRSVLVDVFAITKFPSSDTREELALILNHTSRSIQIWFQNNRHNVNTQESDEIKLKFGVESFDENNGKKKTVDRDLLSRILETHFSSKTRAIWEPFINYQPGS